LLADDASTPTIMPADRRRTSCNGKLRPCTRQIKKEKAREPCGARAKSKAGPALEEILELGDGGNRSHCLSVANVTQYRAERVFKMLLQLASGGLIMKTSYQPNLAPTCTHRAAHDASLNGYI
jgi:hypothetical protein